MCVEEEGPSPEGTQQPRRPLAGPPSDGTCCLLPGPEPLTWAPCHCPEHPCEALRVSASCPHPGRGTKGAFHLLLILLHAFER